LFPGGADYCRSGFRVSFIREEELFAQVVFLHQFVQLSSRDSGYFSRAVDASLIGD
jgi:hypothetical protein